MGCAEHAHQFLIIQDAHADRLSLTSPRYQQVGGTTMEIVYARCCGLDVHQRTVVACLLIPGAERQPTSQPTKEIRTFGTMTNDLLALSDW